MLCVGASDGSTSVIQLDESLSTCSKLDRTNANDMFDRYEQLGDGLDRVVAVLTFLGRHGGREFSTTGKRQSKWLKNKRQ